MPQNQTDFISTSDKVEVNRTNMIDDNSFECTFLHDEKNIEDVKKKYRTLGDLNEQEYTDKQLETIGKTLEKLFDSNYWINLFRWSKENLSTVILWASGLGAILQTVEIFRIHPSYIKFFSFSQLAIDGATILTLLFAAYFSTLFIAKFLAPTVILNDLKNTLNKEKKFSPFEIYIRFPITFFFLTILIRVFIDIDVYDIQKHPFFYLYIIIMMLGLTSYFILYTHLFNDYTNREYSNIRCNFFGKIVDIKPIYKKLSRFTTYALIVTLICICIKMPVMYYNSWKLPYKLDNFSTLQSHINKDYPNKKFRILYMNDTYTFVRIIDKNNVIKVYKNEDVYY